MASITRVINHPVTDKSLRALLTQLCAYLMYCTLQSGCRVLTFPRLLLAQASCLQTNQAVSAGVSEQLILCHHHSNNWGWSVFTEGPADCVVHSTSFPTTPTPNMNNSEYMQSQHVHWSHWNEQKHAVLMPLFCSILHLPQHQQCS